MKPIEWLRYRLHGVAWRIPVWLIVFIIVILLIVNVAVFIYQPWPHAVFSTDLNYRYQKENVSNSGYHLYVVVTGTVTNIGNANGTCSLEIRVKETHGYIGEYSEIIDMGVMAPGSVYTINWKHYLYTYSDDNSQVELYNFEITYRIYS